MRRMMVDIPPKWKQLWDTWDLRGFIILSLSLQTFLILFAPLRKRTSSNWIIMPLWSAYLLADWVANFSLGLILNNQENPNCLSSKKGDDQEDLLAFWAPFLLVHLGGPDAITAFALEDNEFWLRHLIGLVIQASATLYVFVRSLPHNQLWIPTILMFMNGTIKYAERTRAFYLASAERFKWSMNTNADSNLNYMELMDEHLLKKTSKLETPIQMTPEPEKDNLTALEELATTIQMTTKPDKDNLTALEELATTIQMTPKPEKEILTDLEVVQYAYCFFSTFKGLVVDLIFKRKTRDQSRDFFLKQTAIDAFRVVEVELNFIYLVLFTKLPVVYGHFGTISRLFSFLTIFSAIGLFINVQKAKFNTIDVKITYGLLFNALALDTVALFMLLFSEKTVLLLSKSIELGKKPLWTQILGLFHTGSNPEKQIWLIQFFKRRWSETIRTYNIIDSCLHPHSRFMQLVYDLLGINVFVDYMKYVKAKRLTINLKDFIFGELKLKSELVDNLETATEISSSRGDWVLRVEDGWSRLLPYTLDGDFGQRILLWHVATNLCYNKELNDKLKSEGHVNTKNKYREIAMVLSDYMMYLLIMKPSMMSSITSTVQIQFLDLCAHVKTIFKSGKLLEVNQVRKQRQRSEDIEVDLEQLNACMKIFAIPEDVWVRNVKGDLKKSLLLYGFNLAKEVMKIEEEDRSLNKWLIISKVWVELMCYGASHSQSKVQAAQVSSGGELITIVWLMMAQLGLGDQFQINEQQKKARLIVD